MSEGIEETKRCPSCDKKILIKAKKCPYCQQDLRNFLSRHPILTVLGAFFVIFFIIFQMIMSSAPKISGPSTSRSSGQTTFVASANFTGSEFVISNLDEHTCENARMQVNSDYELDGYTLESGLTSVTKSGQVTVYKVGAGQFVKKEGTRFNPFSTKPQSFYIECRGNNELTNAYWYGAF
jgi:hypothetical protein